MRTKKIILIAAAILLSVFIHRRAEAQIFAVRVNVLEALAATANVGIDISIADKWTLDVTGIWNPIDTPTFSSRFLGAQIGAKRWLYESFVGHFVGTQFTYGSYLWGGKSRYWKGDTAGFGVSYGYALLLSKRWNLTFEAGIGIYFMRDARQQRLTPDYDPIIIRHNRRWAIGPSRAEVSFNYLF